MLLAWAPDLGPSEVLTALEPFPNLGAVLYQNNYYAALENSERPWIAFVNGHTAARRVTELVAAGAKFEAVIVKDERNVHNGPSGPYMSPVEYRAEFESIRKLLPILLPVSTMGLASTGGFWQRTLWDMRFDDAYHMSLPAAPLQAANPNKTRRPEVERLLGRGVDILSPAPFRPLWYRFMQPVKINDWLAYERDPRVFAVCLWSLVEQADGLHGLLTRSGRLTSVGRAVLER